MLEDLLLDDIISSAIVNPQSRREDWGEFVPGARKDDFWHSQQYAQLKSIISSNGYNLSNDYKPVIRAINRKLILQEPTYSTVFGAIFQFTLCKEIQPNLLKVVKDIYCLKARFTKYISILEAASLWNQTDDLYSMYTSVSDKEAYHYLACKDNISWLNWFASVVNRIALIKGDSFDIEELLKDPVKEEDGRNVYRYYGFPYLVNYVAKKTTEDYAIDYLQRQLSSFGPLSPEEWDRFTSQFSRGSKSAGGQGFKKPDPSTGYVRPKKVIPAYQNAAPRVGPTQHLRRLGDVTEEEVATRFGFRAIQYGNWVYGKERQEFLNQVSDACADLAFALGIPEQKVGFDGFLALAIGARGNGKHSAHYEPGYRIINLTKTRGAGALAHEWAHALDHYFLWREEQVNGYATLSPGSDQERFLQAALGHNHGYNSPNKTMAKALLERELLPITSIKTAKEADLVDRLILHLSSIFRTTDYLNFFSKDRGAWKRTTSTGILKKSILSISGEDESLTDFVDRLSETWTSPLAKLYNRAKTYPYSADFYFSALILDKFSKGKYWSSTVEMWARIISACIHDEAMEKGVNNDFLSGFSAPRIFTEDRYLASPNPEGEERVAMLTHFRERILPLIQSL